MVTDRWLWFFCHTACSFPIQDHHWAVSVAIQKPPTDWRRPVGRPRHTCAVESDLRPLNTGLSSAWRKAANWDAWRSLVGTAMLKTSLPWKKKRDDGGGDNRNSGARKAPVRSPPSAYRQLVWFSYRWDVPSCPINVSQSTESENNYFWLLFNRPIFPLVQVRRVPAERSVEDETLGNAGVKSFLQACHPTNSIKALKEFASVI